MSAIADFTVAQTVVPFLIAAIVSAGVTGILLCIGGAKLGGRR